ncbi:MAG: hypothetical protein EOO27_41820 [Comamonadaceae bacterium]|nr:MAG: hypothetical protein EOO27_41820 [Comamonadaceae bacterium]
MPGLVIRGHLIAVVSEFDSIEDFYTYLEHPAHQAISLDHLASWSSVQFLVDD